MIEIDPNVEKDLPVMIKVVRDFIKNHDSIRKKLEDSDDRL